MATSLKTTVHQLIDEIENEQLLETIRDFLSLKKEKEPGSLWEELPKKEKEEILGTLEDDESTFISRDTFLKRSK